MVVWAVFEINGAPPAGRIASAVRQEKSGIVIHVCDNMNCYAIVVEKRRSVFRGFVQFKMNAKHYVTR